MKNILVEVREFFNRYRNLVQWMGLIFIGVIILIARNADPIYNPAMYTEDGTWLGIAYTKGWLHALLNAKEGYFVWGNLILLGLASVSSKVICGSELVCLPQSVAFFSYLYFSITSVIAFFVTKYALSLYGRLLLFIWILLIPLGDSSNEIIGRLSNIGYLMVVWSVLLVHFKSKTDRKSNQTYADIGLIFASITNPFCMVLIPILVLVAHARELFISPINCIKKLKTKFGLVILLITLFATCSHFFFLENATSSITGRLDSSNLVEVGIARSILYPLVFPFYSALNDWATLTLFTTLVFFAVILIRNTNFHADAARLMLLASVALFFHLVATIYFRQSLTQQLGGYSTTFPDRYFMGLNVLVILIILLIIGGKVKSPNFLKARKLSFFTILALYISHLTSIIEYDNPRYSIVKGPSFTQSLCEQEVIDHDIINLPIYFQGWNMSITSAQLHEALEIISCSTIKFKISDNFYISDVNWEKGISRKRAGFYTQNTELNRSNFKVGNTVIFSNGDKRSVVSTTENGPYLNIWVDGEILNPEDVGLPGKFEIAQ